MKTLIQMAEGKGLKTKSFRLRLLAFPVRARQRGYLLIELLVYIAVLAVVLAITTKAFYRCWDDSKALSRNADDISRALHAGEQWRADLRAATGAVELTRTGDGERFLVPSAAGPIIYTFAAGELRRQTPSPAPTYLMLSNIQSSQMQSDQRQRVQAWTWELELKPTRKDAKVRPRFTFETVAGPANTR
jgi:Tfp pilus assembly protein FimT